MDGSGSVETGAVTSGESLWRRRRKDEMDELVDRPLSCYIHVSLDGLLTDDMNS